MEVFMIYKRNSAAREAALDVAKKMVAAAMTAPKGHGTDNLEAVILDGEEKDRLASIMRDIAEETGADFFKRDAACLDGSVCIVLLATRNKPIGLSDCGFCGFGTCGGAKKAGANCAFNVNDLGLAIGSAVSIAADNRMDNRVLFSAGKGALRMGIFHDDVRVCFGIPLSVSGKSVFFDREA